MPRVDEHGRAEPPMTAGETETLLGFLEWQRSTLEWKTRGLGREGLTRMAAASTMTLGGILKHMAWVEDHWFSHVLHGRDRAPSWRNVDLAAEPDWEWVSATGDAPDELRSMWASSCAASREAVSDALALEGVDRISARAVNHGERPTLRWILLHMIEEYARHNGHADLLREAVDGEVGE